MKDVQIKILRNLELMLMPFSFLKKGIREKMYSDFDHANKSFSLSFSINLNNLTLYRNAVIFVFL